MIPVEYHRAVCWGDPIGFTARRAGVSVAEILSARVARRFDTVPTVDAHPGRVRFEAAQGDLSVSGYATIFDSFYAVAGGPEAGGFLERITATATTKSARGDDVPLLINHQGLPIARTSSGTLILAPDKIGLAISAVNLDPANPDVQRVASAIARGDVSQMSFAFRPVVQSWNADYTQRTISEVKLFDVSIVTSPANPATSIGLRTGRSLRQAQLQAAALRQKQVQSSRPSSQTKLTVALARAQIKRNLR